MSIQHYTLPKNLNIDLKEKKIDGVRIVLRHIVYISDFRI